MRTIACLLLAASSRLLLAACGGAEARQTQLELVGPLGGKAVIDGDGFVFTRAGGDPALTYSKGSLTMRDSKHAISIGQGELRLERACNTPGCEPATIVIDMKNDAIEVRHPRGTTKITPGALVAEAADTKIELLADGKATRLDLHGPKLPSETGRGKVSLVAAKDFSSVSAATEIDSPTESVAASLGSAPRGAGLTLSKIGETKSLSVGK